MLAPQMIEPLAPDIAGEESLSSGDSFPNGEQPVERQLICMPTRCRAARALTSSR
jgi:hypothetical protein